MKNENASSGAGDGHSKTRNNMRIKPKKYPRCSSKSFYANIIRFALSAPRQTVLYSNSDIIVIISANAWAQVCLIIIIYQTYL